MNAGVTVILVLATFAAAVGLACLSTRCQHVDDDDQSLLMWTWHAGAVRGWCPRCARFTSGWRSDPPQFDRLPSARIATADEVARFRKQRDARRRTRQRMRTA
jgi:hypothetical protein